MAGTPRLTLPSPRGQPNRAVRIILPSPRGHPTQPPANTAPPTTATNISTTAATTAPPIATITHATVTTPAPANPKATPALPETAQAATPLTTRAATTTATIPQQQHRSAVPATKQPLAEQSKRPWSSLFTTQPNTNDRVKLHYDPPTKEGDRLLISATPEELAEGRAQWQNTLVGYFIGSRLPYHIVKTRAEALWKPVGGMEILTLPAGFFIFRFSLSEDRNRILEGGPWFFQNRLLLLKPWDQNTKLQKISLSAIPIWLKIHDLPMSLWTPTLISKIASTIGVPLYMDQATANMTRISYARVCIEVSADQELPTQISFSVIGDQECTLRLEYDRRPPRCSLCCVFGHGDMNCPLQPAREKAVWRPKQNQSANTDQPSQPVKETEQNGGYANVVQPQTDLGQNLPNVQIPATTTQALPAVCSKEQPSHRGETGTPAGGTVIAHNNEQSPSDRKKKRGKQPMIQGNNSLVIQNRFQFLNNDAGNTQDQDQTDHAGPSSKAGCEQFDPPP